MVSYAPLFAHVDGWQWSPDLIWFNNLTSYGTTNYYVQKLFSTNKGTDLLSILQENKPVAGQNDIYASAVLDKNSGEVILKIVNTNHSILNKTFQIQTTAKINSKAVAIVLQNDNPDAMNTIGSPMDVKPVNKELNVKGKSIDVALDPYSLTVLKIKLEK
jgi:alpha-L-arabinofuranosidase